MHLLKRHIKPWKTTIAGCSFPQEDQDIRRQEGGAGRGTGWFEEVVLWSWSPWFEGEVRADCGIFGLERCGCFVFGVVVIPVIRQPIRQGYSIDPLLCFPSIWSHYTRTFYLIKLNMKSVNITCLINRI